MTVDQRDAVEEIYKWIALTPLPRDNSLLAILLRIDTHIAENTEIKSGDYGIRHRPM